MELIWLKPWLALVHELSLFAFLMAHGTSVFVALRLRSETDHERIARGLELSGMSSPAMFLALLALLASGILSGIVGGWWTSGQLWIWVSVALLVALVVLMYALPVRHLNAVRHALGRPTYADVRKGRQPPLPAGEAEVTALLASPLPLYTAAISFGGIALITWLMIMKPF